jgi:DNA-binding response OmpR family regulator
MQVEFRSFVNRQGSKKVVMIPIDDTAIKQPPKIFVICDLGDTAPVWGYILKQQGLIVIMEPKVEKALERWSAEMPELIVIDIEVAKHDPLELCKKFRAISVAPVLLFLPAYHETQILDAYALGVDDVIVKPVSPPIFMAKIQAWMRRTWVMPIDSLNLVKAGRYRLVPLLRCIIDPNEEQIKLTNLEFRLLHLLMSRPSHVFMAEEIIQAIWGGYENGDHVLLKNVVYRLRRKIEMDPGNPVVIQTWPRGYSFNG